MPQAATAKKKSKTSSKPRSALTERNQVRSAPGEWERWQALAIQLGYGGASPLLRKLGNEAVAKAEADGSLPSSRS